MYSKFLKRILDIICAILALVLFGWLYVIIAILVKCKLGSPILFSQIRPGKKDDKGVERLFRLYKFRTMTNEKDEKGDLLPDVIRLTKFGKWLRSTSLDELPEVLNILKGDMSLIGPRPQLVRDMVFMTKEQRKRHNVRPGLSGLAQVRGRNAIGWEQKLSTDLEYVKHISLWNDFKIVIQTVKQVVCREGITEEGEATATDFGVYLRNNGLVSKEEFDEKMESAKKIVRDFENGCP